MHQKDQLNSPYVSVKNTYTSCAVAVICSPLFCKILHSMNPIRNYLVLVSFLLASIALPYDGKLFTLATGAKFSNDLVRRGALLYDGVQASPLIYLGMFDERIQFFGMSLELTDFVASDVLRLRTKINSVSDRPLFMTAGPLTARNARESSWEWTTRVEAFFPNFKTTWYQIDLAYSKDIKAHGGHYLELTARVTLGRFRFENEKPSIQPQFFATLAWGDGRHNDYLYGTSGQLGGLNHVAYGFMLVSPSRIDPHFPVVTFYRYDVLGDANRAGSLLSQYAGFHLDVTVAFGIL